MTRRRALIGIAGVAVALVAGWLTLRRTGAAVETVTVARGEYADVIEIRGQVQAVRSTFVTAPFNAGELQILKIARNGTPVRAGDVVAEFDAVTLRQTIQEKQSALRSATAERDQGDAQAAIVQEEKQAAIKKAEFDVTKARLSLGETGLVSEIDAAKARLALADAEQRLREAQAAAEAAAASARTDHDARSRTIEKTRTDLQLAERQLSALSVTAPTDGTVNILPNYRSTSPLGEAQEYRAGDRAYPGAVILELPDLSSVFLTARIDESDRGRLVTGQAATIRVDAVADRDYRATVRDISLLARVDFTGGWPPPKQFDLALAFTDPDDRLRPGMSAVARIIVGRLADALLVPSSAIFYESGRTVVYRVERGAPQAIPVKVLRRGRDQAAIEGSVEAGDLIARTDPQAAPVGGTP